MNKLEQIRQAAIKSGIAQGNATAVPMHKLETFAQQIRSSTCDELADKVNMMPFGDTSSSFSVWIREQK